MELYDEAMELLQEADVNVGVELEVKYNIQILGGYGKGLSQLGWPQIDFHD